MLATWAHLDMEELCLSLKGTLEGYQRGCALELRLVLRHDLFCRSCYSDRAFCYPAPSKKWKSFSVCICIALGIALSSYSLYNVWTTLDIDTYLRISEQLQHFDRR